MMHLNPPHPERSLSLELDDGHRRRGDKINLLLLVPFFGKSVMSARVLEMPLLIVGVGTVLRLESDAWSMVNWLLVRQAANEYALPPPHTIVNGMMYL